MGLIEINQGLAARAVAWDPFLLGMVWVSLALLTVGFLVKGPSKHLWRIAGYTLFGLYWPTQAPGYYIGSPDDNLPNFIGALLAPLITLYFIIHESRSLKWKEDPAALRWFAGSMVVSAATYFAIYKIPAVSMWLIRVVADQSAWVVRVFFRTPAVAIQDPLTGDSNIFINGSTYAVTVILACTAIQSIMIFWGAIATLDTPWRRRIKGFLIVGPTIYIVNLFRNAFIVWGYKVKNLSLFGLDSFDFLHSYVAKFGSLFLLILLALWVFVTLPELHNNILDLFDLRKRKAPGYFDRAPPPPGSPPSEPPATSPGLPPAKLADAGK